ncbi:hypothetical protein PNEG_03228 [Pneumocystis murina B123]|uniref:Flap endonuclease 1 n=1 Tax=Pneumocystis murina (strain B123) TaxID=1069680 RepID=M7NMN5_PNEMU|nr:hypothetical protein PNEG_03228 [Pneumocystis murina B123]EMR08391.1 hypothetical protein PNEG_03228 [Pneumocystis murina B123]
MGIKHLRQLLEEHASSCIKLNNIDHYFGRKVAIDASMSIYQFLIAVRQQDGQQLMTETGETTSHLMGIFYRTLRMCDNGIKPCYVFDGSPPKLKSGELAKRLERREEAVKLHSEAKEIGSIEDINKFSKRIIRVTREHNEECKKLLKLMGIPCINAPCEAEAQCAALAKSGKVYAAASEDMDTLCFSTPILLRHLTFSEQKKEPISEVNLEKALKELYMPLEQFVDLCILLGCDYCEPIKGIGPKRALELIREYKSLDTFISSADGSKYQIPENWPYKDARDLFLNPDITNPETLELKWESPDAKGLLEFLVKEKGFNEERVNNGILRLEKALKSSQQVRLDSFFKVIPKLHEATSVEKRKTEENTHANKKNRTNKKKK